MQEQVSVKQKVYDAIAENSSISRIRLAEKYNLRLATVTEVTRRLLEDKLIVEGGEEESTGGRKPVLLHINPDAFHTVGLLLGREYLYCGLFNSALQQKHEIIRKTNQAMSRDEFLDLLKNTVHDIISESGLSADQLKGIGIGLPDRVDTATGIYNGAGFYPHLKQAPIKDVLEEEFQLPVIVDHDVVLMTLAEYYLAGGSVPDNLGVLFIGRAIGCRFIIGGEIYRGVSNRASEFGHLSLLTNGPECYCGNCGCFEQLASLSAIENGYGGGVSFEEIVERANEGEKKALDVLHQTADFIGQGCANIINLMDVEMLIINGDIVAAQEVIEPRLLNYMQTHRIGARPEDQRRVFFSSIGKKVGMLGPALVAADANFLLMDINIFPQRRI